MEIVEGRAYIDDVEAFVDKLETIEDAYGSTVQAFDARYVVDRKHLERAVELAKRAFDRGETIARNRGVEILLYAAGRRQIDRAMEMGVSTGDCPVVVVTLGGEADQAALAVAELLESEQTLGAYETDRVRTFFDVTDRELAATTGTLPEVIHERVTMLVVKR